MLSSAEHSRSSARNALARLERLILRHYGFTLIEQRKSRPPSTPEPTHCPQVDEGELSNRAATLGRARAA